MRRLGAAKDFRTTAPAFVLATVVLAASLIGLTIDHTITVAGVVFDARTMQPVAGAVVQAAEPKQPTISGTADAKGHFVLLKVPKGATLQLTAPNYFSVTRAASTDPLRLALRPIPVTGRVSSAFTKAGIPATYSGRASGRTARDGTFTMYGAGPGDSVSFSSFGHRTKSVAIDRSRHLDVSLDLGQIDPASLLVNISGLTYENAPQSVLAQFRQEINAYGPVAKSVTGFAARLYRKGTAPAAIAEVISVDPALASAPGFADEILLTLSKEAPGAVIVKEAIDGVTVERAQVPDAVVYVWQRYAAFVFVIGPNVAAADPVVRATVAAH